MNPHIRMMLPSQPLDHLADTFPLAETAAERPDCGHPFAGARSARPAHQDHPAARVRGDRTTRPCRRQRGRR
jgi:hypothetical protein